MSNSVGNLRSSRNPIWGSVVLFFCSVSVVTAAPRISSEPIEYARDIQPIIANHCLDCHGGNVQDRQSELRLDSAEQWYDALESGRVFIVPGSRRKSEFFRRINSSSDSGKMPPADYAQKHGRALSNTQIQLIGDWIDQSGMWQPHWAYQIPQRPEIPNAPLDKRHKLFAARNAIDLFVQNRAALSGEYMNPPADRHTLFRRLHLDLSGLPPTFSKQQLFEQTIERYGFDKAWDLEVDRLLASPAYGERMSVHWLDLARYADTHGYHIDSHRDMWRWRDWVIDAFNTNMPFDRFTIEQLAGDLLEKPTLDQLIATGFNRNHMINFEGGALEEEYQSEYVMDRVSTTATVWLGQTIGCSRCHDHKFDPLSQRDFYRFYAFFNNIDEVGIDGRAGNAKPYIEAPTQLQQRHRTELSASIREHEQMLTRRVAESDRAVQEFTELVLSNSIKLPGSPNDMKVGFAFDSSESDSIPPHRRNLPAGKLTGNRIYLPGKFSESLLFDGDTYVAVDDSPSLVNNFTLSMWIYPTTEDDATLFSQATFLEEDLAEGYEIAISQGCIAIRLAESVDKVRELRSDHHLKTNQWQHVTVQFSQTDPRPVDSAEQLLDEVAIFVDGKPTAFELFRANGMLTAPSIKTLAIGGSEGGDGFRGMIDEVRAYSRKLDLDEIALLGGGNPIRTIIDTPENDRTADQAMKLAYFVLAQTDPDFEKLQSTIDEQRNALEDIARSVSSTMVMSEREDVRKTYVFPDGTYQTQGEEVAPGTPSVFYPMDDQMPANRLGLAQWIVDKRNPLTARVTVNRLWAMFFGKPIVATAEDFGTRGSMPSHPDLLDWLAVEFQENGWDIKYIVRLIVTSSTYRQSSSGAEDVNATTLFARYSRQRLSAEMVRDAAIKNAGLLVDRIGGNSVYPYHPRGLWKEVSFNPRDFTAQVYIQGSGADLYRRSIYTFWKRTVPPPELAVFDAVNRETCVAVRPVSNTPMQALVLMNSPTHVEAARSLANQLLVQDLSTQERLRRLFRIVVSRPITASESLVLERLLNLQIAGFSNDEEAAGELVAVGESDIHGAVEITHLAAWTVVCSTIMMSDEALHKP